VFGKEEARKSWLEYMQLADTQEYEVTTRTTTLRLEVKHDEYT
jgi:hypothetical protein